MNIAKRKQGGSLNVIQTALRVMRSRFK